MWPCSRRRRRADMPDIPWAEADRLTLDRSGRSWMFRDHPSYPTCPAVRSRRQGLRSCWTAPGGHSGWRGCEELASFLRRRRGAADAGRRRAAPRCATSNAGAAARRGGGAGRHVHRLLHALEQSRGRIVHPAAGLAGARARLTDDRARLPVPARRPPTPVRHGTDPHVSPGLLYLLARLDDVPRSSSPTSRRAGADPMSVAAGVIAPRRRGVGPQLFPGCGSPTRPRARRTRRRTGTATRPHVSDLRATAARRQGDADVTAAGPSVCWPPARSSPRCGPSTRVRYVARPQRIVHPRSACSNLLCETLVSGVGEQILVVLLPAARTDARAKLELLRVIGTQNLSSIS